MSGTARLSEDSGDDKPVQTQTKKVSKKPKIDKSLRVGNKAQVHKGEADITPGGLTANDVMVNKKGKVVSKKKHDQGMILQKKNAQLNVLKQAD